jgi:hypothetical protein
MLIGFLEAIWQDISYALRTMRKNQVYAVMCLRSPLASERQLRFSGLRGSAEAARLS